MLSVTCFNVQLQQWHGFASRGFVSDNGHSCFLIETPWSYKFIAHVETRKITRYQRHLASDIESKNSFLPTPFLFDAP